MAISFEQAFGVHQYTVGVREQRAEILASNIANADTPHYKSRDVDFQAALATAQKRQGFALETTQSSHLDHQSTPMGDVKYRQVNQPDTGDGNSVDVQVERNLYLQNAMEYQASLRFLNGKMKSMMSAIKGE